MDTLMNRRRVLVWIGAAAVAPLAATPALADDRPPTPRMTEGPFYPRKFPADFDADLTRVAGKGGVAEGKILDVGGRAVKATFDKGQFEADRIAAVQYIRLRLGPDLTRQFRNEATPAALRVDHGHYRHQTALTGEERRSLIADLDPAC